MKITRIVVCAVVVPSVLALAACGGGGGAKGVAGKDAYEQHPITHSVSAAEVAFAKSGAPIAADSALLWVNGMGCPLCASNIDKHLLRLPGVSKADVDLGQGTVTLGLKPGAAHPSPARLGEAVEDAGFTLVKVQTP